jgi:hypothetical protein
MDPKAAQQAQASFMLAMHLLDIQYMLLMQRMGVKEITLHRI